MLKEYKTHASFYDNNGNEIAESDSLKILGFRFSNKPNMTAQVTSILGVVRLRLWMLTHLFHNGFSQDDLVKVYTTMVLPIHDYCSTVYHHSITAAQ